MITNKEIKLGDKYPNDFVDYNAFTSKNKAVNEIEDLLKNNRNKDKEAR